MNATLALDSLRRNPAEIRDVGAKQWSTVDERSLGGITRYQCSQAEAQACAGAGMRRRTRLCMATSLPCCLLPVAYQPTTSSFGKTCLSVCASAVDQGLGLLHSAACMFLCTKVLSSPGPRRQLLCKCACPFRV